MTVTFTDLRRRVRWVQAMLMKHRILQLTHRGRVVGTMRARTRADD